MELEPKIFDDQIIEDDPQSVIMEPEPIKTLITDWNTNRKKKGTVCQSFLKSGQQCTNKARPKYDNLYCGVHARSKGYVTIEESRKRIQLSSQPTACGVKFNEDGTVQLDVLTLESMKIYQHQFHTATRVVNYLQNGEEHVLVAAEPQLGKTGTIQTICWMATRLNRDVNPIVILPMNDNDLAKQIVRDYSGLVPETNILNSQHLRDHLYLQKILAIEKINWIIIDESHLGTTFINGNNTLKRELDSIGVNLNLSQVPSNVRLISVSATPMAEVASLSNPALTTISNTQLTTEYQNCTKPKVLVTMDRPENYFGIRDIHSRGQIVQTGCLRDLKWCQQFLDYLEIKCGSEERKCGYIICRVTKQSSNILRSAIIERFHDIEIGDSVLPYKIIDCHHKKEKTVDFNQLISQSPSCPTFLFIYGRLRASKRLEHKEHLIAVHDYSKSCDATVQGLLGRLCGYQEHDVRVFLNLQLLLPYLNWLHQDFSPRAVPDKSRNIIGGVTYQQLKQVARGFIPVAPIMIGLESENLEYFTSLYQEFKKTKGTSYYQIADRVIEKFISLNNENCLYGRTIELVNGKSEQLKISGKEYSNRAGNSMMYITTENSERTVKLFQNRYQSYLKGQPVFPFTVSGVKEDNVYFIYINLVNSDWLKPCLFLGLVDYQQKDSRILPTTEKLEVKPTSLYYLN